MLPALPLCWALLAVAQGWCWLAGPLSSSAIWHQALPAHQPLFCLGACALLLSVGPEWQRVGCRSWSLASGELQWINPPGSHSPQPLAQSSHSLVPTPATIDEMGSCCPEKSLGQHPVLETLWPLHALCYSGVHFRKQGCVARSFLSMHPILYM